MDTNSNVHTHRQTHVFVRVGARVCALITGRGHVSYRKMNTLKLGCAGAYIYWTD